MAHSSIFFLNSYVNWNYEKAVSNTLPMHKKIRQWGLVHCTSEKYVIAVDGDVVDGDAEGSRSIRGNTFNTQFYLLRKQQKKRH